MRWFEGSIPDAINSAKQRSCVFVVVITGEDEQSAHLMSSWEDHYVSEAAHTSFVAIKVDAKSFFIGENGIPLEVIAGSVSAEELMKRINRVKQMHAQQIGSKSVLPEASVLLESQRDNTATEEPAAVSGIGKTSISNTEGDGSLSAPVSLVENASSDTATQCSQSQEDLEAKVERLTKKLEERREQRKMGEEENEIKKEIERRKVGKDTQDFKRKQEEENTKRLLEERNRQKAEEKAARERVKQQIALDRADRAARYAKTREQEKAAKEAQLQARQAEQEEVGNRYGNFSLATMFPRREFTNEDLNRTLQSGRPGNAVVQSSAGGIWAVLGTLLYPLLAVWRFLSSFLFATPPPPAATSRGPAPQSSSYNNSTSGSDKAKRENLSKHSLEKQPKDFKKDGKVCRLRTQEDSEDDNNTWNGNSTQQM
ncbi:UBX domain-containing protein 4 [Nibea albiflora]|uniref:UBX domain-containing protein 4 n=1 Tax=Nibea albiflora TaxID=240163 RepID=A0ACB7EFY3_NIBAL|nr:UBX domain-containing protein 4 [Nibea albiflora]